MMYDDHLYEEYFKPPDPKPGDRGTCAICGQELTLMVVDSETKLIDWRHTLAEEIRKVHCNNPELGGPA